jgi:hypothetical protein
MPNNKYNARKVTIGGYTFDSQAEARRYQQLLLLQSAGEIFDLEVHPVFVLLPGFKSGWKMISKLKYEADFRYSEYLDPPDQQPTTKFIPRKSTRRSKRVVEDVKGAKTAEFKVKEKLFRFWMRYVDEVENMPMSLVEFWRIEYRIIPAGEV